MQDIEQGIAGTATPTEEAIDTLINSYKSSESYHQLQRHVAELNKKVS